MLKVVPLISNRWIKFCLSTVLLFFLFSKVDWNLIRPVVNESNKLLLLGAILILPVSMSFRILKWHLLTNSQVCMSWIEVIYSYSVGLFFSSVTPSKLGDFVRVKHLTDRGVSWKGALSLNLLDRGFDLFAICLGAFWAASISKNFLIFSITASLFGLILVGLIFLDKFVIFLFNFNIKSLSKFMANQINSEFLEPIKDIRKQSWIILLFFGIMIWLSLAVQTGFILASFGFTLPIWKIWTSISMGAIAGLIPISFSGLGVRESLIAVTFTGLGVDWSVSLIVAFVYTFLSFLLPALVSGVLYFYVENKK